MNLAKLNNQKLKDLIAKSQYLQLVTAEKAQSIIDQISSKGPEGEIIALKFFEKEAIEQSKREEQYSKDAEEYLRKTDKLLIKMEEEKHQYKRNEIQQKESSTKENDQNQLSKLLEELNNGRTN